MANERIFKLLEKKGITQYRLSKDIGVSEGLISEWKGGKCKPTTERLIKLAKYFGVSIDYLLGVTDNQNFSEIQSIFEQLTPEEQAEVLQNLYKQYPKINK